MRFLTDYIDGDITDFTKENGNVEIQLSIIGLTMNELGETKEIVRKCLHYSAYHHMLTYDYNALKNIAIQLAYQQQQKHQ